MEGGGRTAKIVTWNIERQAPGSRKAKIMLERIAALSPDIVCLTEGFEGSTAILGGFEISVSGVSWADEAPTERKVVLWSKHPWAEIAGDLHERLQSGAYLEAASLTPIGRIRFLGVCIPYHFASPAGVLPKARPWSEQLRFIGGLRSATTGMPDQTTVVLGDFNQYFPRIWGSKAASAVLIEALGDFQICTAGPIPGVDHPAIDHIALSPDLEAISVTGIDEHDGQRLLSDHFGLSVTIARKAQD